MSSAVVSPALEAIERLGAVWTKAALVVQRPRQ
jgi:hypothetical protein